MKKVTKIFIITTLLFSCSGLIHSQDTSAIKFLPLQVGNVWVYQCSAGGQCGFCTKRIKVKVLNTNVINGKTYYQSQVTTILISGTCAGGVCGVKLLPFDSFMRIDSLKANVLLYSTTGGCPYSPNEILKDSLKAKLHDTIRYDCQTPTQWNTYICTDTNNVTIFGVSRPARSYNLHGFENNWGRGYVKGIGLSYAGSVSLYCNDQTLLRGCVINGIVYGDTSMVVGIKQISSEVPNVYILYQNYPNPFNPATKIKFDIPATPLSSIGEGPGVRLIIYDVLGREVAVIVNEQLKPGTYEGEFDGTNYPSGVYFYKLQTETFSLTKKMIFLK